MASVSKESGRDSWKLTWRLPDGRRKSIRLGAMPKKSAESFRVRFEELLGVNRAGDRLPQGVTDWVEGLDPDIRERMAAAGVIKRQERMTLGGLCDAFLASRSGVAEATKVRDRQVVDRLLGHFGRDRSLEAVTVRDAEEWRRLLAESGNKRDTERAELGDNTVRRRTGVARQIFATAIRWDLLKANPFDGLATTVRENLERRAFVEWSDILKVINVAPDAEWRAFIAFCRLIGPRVPSELAGLTWADVNFTTRRVVIRSPKTKHHGGAHAMRPVPLFPEVLPYLEDLASVVRPGVGVPMTAAVFPRAVDPAVNLRTQFNRLIVRAGLVPWEKLFVNLRSSRETELLAVYPAADVCRWMGHSPAVAARFYAQARPEIADRAATETTVLPGVEMGDTVGDLGVRMGAIGPDHTPPKTHHREAEPVDKQEVMTGPGVFVLGPDGTPEWAMRDSNPRHSRCKRDALAN